MHFLITGSSGLVGRALIRKLHANGDTVSCLVRRQPAGPREIEWDPSSGKLNPADLEGLDAVIHLAGESISSGRWNTAKRARILNSRVEGTGLIARTLAELERKPRLFISASAIGIYGHRPDEVLNEESAVGSGFLADVCNRWEAATEPASAAGIRTIKLRIGMVISQYGGGLEKMLLPFKLGLGGRFGHGRQVMSWLELSDLTRIMEHCVATESLSGPVNAIAPHQVTNGAFTKALGRQLRRPTLIPLPAFVARLALGDMARELLLASAQVEPAALLQSGFEFRYPNLDPALTAALAAPHPKHHDH